MILGPQNIFGPHSVLVRHRVQDLPRVLATAFPVCLLKYQLKSCKLLLKTVSLHCRFRQQSIILANLNSTQKHFNVFPFQKICCNFSLEYTFNSEKFSPRHFLLIPVRIKCVIYTHLQEGANPCSIELSNFFYGRNYFI